MLNKNATISQKQLKLAKFVPFHFLKSGKIYETLQEQLLILSI